MKYILEIDDKTKSAKSLIDFLRLYSASNKGIEFLSPKELEEKEDAILGKLIQKSLKSGLANKQTVLKKLGLK